MEEIKLDIKYGENKLTQGYILDISKSGMAIASCVKIDKDQLIEIIAKEPMSLSLKARVVSISQRDRKPYVYRLGVVYIDFDEEIKKNLTRFILERERRQLGRMSLFNPWKRD